MKHLIITGASKGLGEAVAIKGLALYDHVWCVSRTESAIIKEYTSAQSASYHFLPTDLSKAQDVDHCLAHLWAEIALSSITSIHLINNAATLSPMGLAGHVGRLSAMRAAFSLNVEALIAFCEWFLEKTTSLAADKRILNISSGAGRKAYPAWSVYCATKAAVDRYSTCVSVEQGEHNFPGKIVSLAPGVIETDMQATIRAQEKENFPLLDRFIQLKEEGKLWAPSYAAELLVGFLHSRAFGQDPLFDLRDWAAQVSS
ncbi:MAG: SDR family NAD(P)-dependent oxidoreductase [Bacteroidota bacterium]